ncbi:MAG: DUF1552 domain-containing protein [Gemmataceae bacterium]
MTLLNSPAPWSRRRFLTGLGTALALPALESVAPAAGPLAADTAAATPKRLAFIYVPNGAHMADWTPKSTGSLGELPAILKPLTPFKQQINVLTGLALDKARANGDGPGDHARAMSVFLTGRQPRKTYGADIRVGQSADQHIATAIGDQTRFPSLELGIERGAQAGSCDSGYSCAYSSNLSWRSESTPNAKEIDPKQVFQRLFGNSDPKELAESRARRDLYQKSIIDFVMDDAKSLDKTLSQADKRKMDEYLSAVREVERRIDQTRQSASNRKPVAAPNMTLPASVPSDFIEHVRLMCDIMVLAFQTDLTRVITLPFANDGSNRSYKMIQVPDGHHDLSHHGQNAEKQGKIKKINTLHTEQLAYLLGKLDAVKEPNGKSLLDNLMLVYGSGIGDGDRHNHDDLPILLIGRGQNSIQAGRHLKFANNTPLMNLYLTLFEKMGAPTKRFGDSTGPLSL